MDEIDIRVFFRFFIFRFSEIVVIICGVGIVLVGFRVYNKLRWFIDFLGL